MTNVNPLNNQSYINKDFQTIYPELLDTVKKLTYKWDPTISNESDPGVILIKLNALIADKNNYNIDKNVLECFPSTVTQEGNAYHLFHQLGYNMHWYRGATGKIAVQWGEKTLELNGNPVNVKLPLFTMVSDEDKSIVYTLLEAQEIDTLNKPVYYVDAIQGVVKTYTVGSQEKITLANLDASNKLHFPIPNVAENGVFIQNAVYDNYSNIEPFSNIDEWRRVDNIHTEPLNSKIYSFGVDQSTNIPYIEFPMDIANLIEDGLIIKYIQTDGYNGNIANNIINQPYQDIIEPNTQTNLNKSILFANTSSISNGADPESIDDAYKSYKRVVGTFNTLVTLRDYINYIMEQHELVSNGVVSDRKTDIQNSYKIVTTFDNENKIEDIVSETNGKPDISAFDLKTYFFKYSNNDILNQNLTAQEQVNHYRNNYNKSFIFDTSNGLSTSDDIIAAYEDAKSVNHNFINKLPNRPLAFKNKFNLNINVIPNNPVTQVQAADIEKNIQKALYEELQATNIEMGEELTYERIYDICNLADNRIKAIALDNINYTPYVVIYLTQDYITENEANLRGISDISYINTAGNIIKINSNIELKEGIYEIPLKTKVESNEDIGIDDEISLEIAAKNILAGNTALYSEDGMFKYAINQMDTNEYHNIEKLDTRMEVEFKGLTSTNNFIEDKLESNESILFYAPNLIESEQYSIGVKYVYYTTEEYTGMYKEQLPPNTDLILAKGQVLFMFLKTQDSEGSPYSYTKYGEGTILNTTTTLYRNTNSDLIYSLEYGGYEGSGQILGSLNSQIAAIDDNILSVSKTVTIKKINSVMLNDSNNYCYWITNNIKNNQYLIDFEYQTPSNTVINESFSSGSIIISKEEIEPQKVKTLNHDLYVLNFVPEDLMYYVPYPNNTNSTSYKVAFTGKDSTIYGHYNITKIAAGNSIISTQQILSTTEAYGVYAEVKNAYDNGDTLKGCTEEYFPDFNPSINKNYYKFVPSDFQKALYSENFTTRMQLSENSAFYNISTAQLPTFGSDGSGVSQFKYLLKTNEYFIYTDPTKQEFHMLYPGTSINLYMDNKSLVDIKYKYEVDGTETETSTPPQPGVEYSLDIPLKYTQYGVQTIDNDDILNQGSAAFTSDMWYNFTISSKTTDIKNPNFSGSAIEIVENKLITLGENSYIRITLASDNSNPMPYDFGSLKFCYDGTYTKYSSKDEEYVKMSNILNNYTIQYRADTESSWASIPKTLDNSLSWNAYTILNLNMSTGKPQILTTKHAQTIIAYTLNNDPIEIKPLGYDPDSSNSTPNSRYESLYVQSSMDLDIGGGNNIPTTININDNIIYLSLFSYYITETNIDTSIIDLEYNHDYIKITLHGSTPQIPFNISCDLLPKDNILPITFYDDVAVRTFNITLGYKDSSDNIEEAIAKPINLESIITSDNTILKGIYYFKLPKRENKHIYNIHLEIDSDSDEVTFTFNKLFTYKYMKGSDDVNYRGFNIDESILVNKINEYNIKNKYNYTYQPLENQQITNPLNPKSYFTQNHFCNKFTIPQINSININTLNKRV